MADHPRDAEDRSHTGLPRTWLPYVLGAMALFCMLPEGAVLDWGALYLRQELGGGVATSGLAFAAMSAAMALMRFLGDGIRDRFGAFNTLRFSALVAMSGLLVAASAPNAGVAIAGFALAGVGLSNTVPVLFSAAGNLRALAPGVGLAVVTMMGYSGILVAPAGIGAIAEHTGFRPVFFALPALLVFVLFGARLVADLDRSSR